MRRVPSMSDQSLATVFAPSEAAVCVGLVGAGIQGSLTPAMHMREARAQGFGYEYRLIDTDALRLAPGALPELIERAEAAGFSGLNVTFPFKQAACEYLTDISADAAALRAVNTIVFDGGRRIGHNTDWWGFGRAFERDFGDVRRERVALLGAGGAGAAVAYALLMSNVRDVRIVEAQPGKGAALAADLRELFPAARVSAAPDAASAVAGADGLVNATPVGMAKLPGLPLAPDLVEAGRWLIDIIYFPLETELLRLARQRGAKAANGGGMAVFQAVRAFELFTGRAADPERMEASFRALAAARTPG